MSFFFFFFLRLRLRLRLPSCSHFFLSNPQQVLKKERRLSGQQLDDDRPISVANTGQPVDVNMDNLKKGWKNRYDEPDVRYNNSSHNQLCQSSTLQV